MVLMACVVCWHTYLPNATINIHITAHTYARMYLNVFMRAAYIEEYLLVYFMHLIIMQMND